MDKYVKDKEAAAKFLAKYQELAIKYNNAYDELYELIDCSYNMDFFNRTDDENELRRAINYSRKAELLEEQYLDEIAFECSCNLLKKCKNCLYSN